MLVVAPVYGTDRQSQRRLGPREGGDCTRSLLPTPSTQTSSAPSGDPGGTSDGALPRALAAHSDGSPAPVPLACLARTFNSGLGFLIPRNCSLASLAPTHHQDRDVIGSTGRRVRLHWQAGAAPTPPTIRGRWSHCPGSSGGGLHQFRPQHRRDPSQGQAPAPPLGGPPACRAPTPPGPQAWHMRSPKASRAKPAGVSFRPAMDAPCTDQGLGYKPCLLWKGPKPSQEREGWSPLGSPFPGELDRARQGPGASLPRRGRQLPFPDPRCPGPSVARGWAVCGW